MTYLKWGILIFILCFVRTSVHLQAANSADLAVYQLGLVAEALPGSALTYNLTVTNYGPSVVTSFYILDGWTINDEGIPAFAGPINEPDFGSFTLIGVWQQTRDDQELIAWLLQGELQPGATSQFKWVVQVDSAYQGVLVNWASIRSDGELEGNWLPVGTAPTIPPSIESAVDANTENNRTVDGVTIVTTSPTGEGIDLALYQTGVLSELLPNEPLESTWLVANLGPETVNQFYIVAGETLNSDGGSIFVQPIPEPDFGDFQVIGRWQQTSQDEHLWLWLLEGDLSSGESVGFLWSRSLIPTYRGDMITWAGISGHDIPEGTWVGWGGTSIPPHITENGIDTFPENDKALETLTTIFE